MFPTLKPTREPTKTPTLFPTQAPTEKPTTSPTLRPTFKPTRAGETTEPSSLPTKNPVSSAPSSKPSSSSPSSSSPTSRPTSVPTISFNPTSAPSTFYTGFDARSLQTGLIKDLSFVFYANDQISFSKVTNQWKNFVLTKLSTPFKLAYPYIEFRAGGLSYGSRTTFYNIASCSDPKKNGQLVDSILKNKAISFSCNEVSWFYSGSSLCINCDNRACPTPSENVMIIPSMCQIFPDVKSAGILNIEYETYVEPTVPEINYVTSTADSSNIYLSVNLTGYFPGGKLYCNALRSEVPPSTVSQITAVNLFTSWEQKAERELVYLDLKIPNLVSSVHYNVYCYAADTVGNGISITQIRQTLLVVQTSCCREVKFSQVPTAVYQDPSIYAPSDTSFLFKFSLPFVPEEDLTVTPVFFSRDPFGGVGDVMSAASIFASPSSFYYDYGTQESQLKGTFVINGDPDLYFVYLAISGGTASSYSGALAPFTCVSITTPPPPPMLLNAVFDNSGAFVNVYFDSVTDMGITTLGSEVSSAWNCGNMFKFTGARYVTCTWTSSTQLKIQFGSYNPLVSYLVPGDLLALNPGNVKALCKPTEQFPRKCNTPYSYNEYSSVTILASPSPVIPVIQLKTPTIISVCDDLTIDATSSYGHGGRPWSKVVWSIMSSSSSNHTAMAQYALNMNSTLQETFILSKAYLIPGSSYTVTLSLTNFLGAYSFQSSITVVSTSGDIPAVSILGKDTIAMYSNSRLSVSSQGFPSSCSASKTLIYTWTLYRNFVYSTLVSESVDQRSFKISPFKLDAGYTYQLYVTVTTSLGSFSTKSAQIYILNNVLEAVITGGANRVIPENVDCLLDGSYSVDTNYQTPSESELFYSWACFFVSGATYGTSCNYLIPYDQSSEDKIVIEAFRMWTNSTYQFSLTVSSLDGRSDSTFVVIEPAPAGSPVVILTSTVSQINADQMLIVSGTIAAEGTMQKMVAWWDVPSDTSIELSKSAVTPFFTIFPAKAVTQPLGVSFPLAVSANTFLAGRTYTLRIVAHPYSNPELLVYGETSIQINAAPAFGSLSVNPGNGSALETSFDFRARDWIDDLSSYPFAYSFIYSVAPNQPNMSIVSANPKSFTSSTLPSGATVQQYVVLCYVTVADVFGASSVAASGVRVRMKEGVTSTEAAVSALSSMSAALTSGGMCIIVCDI